jgi:Tfp pilus assembly protein PilX
MRFLAGRRPAHGEEGQTLVIVALVVVVLMGFMALTADVGRAYGERQQLQRTADAAAISGAQGFVQTGTSTVRQAAAFKIAKDYVAANTRPVTEGPDYHASGYTGDLLNPNPGNCYSVVPPNPLAATDCIAAQPAGCPVLAGGSIQNFDCVQSRIVSPNFPWAFASVLGFQPRPLSARSVAIVGTGAPGGSTLMPWLLLDCPDSDGTRGYPDEQTAGLLAAANTVHPGQTCPYEYVYGTAGNEAATYSALTGGGGLPAGSSGALFNLFAGDHTGGNYGAAQMAPSPCVSKFDGYFNSTSGTNDYRDAVAGNPDTCFVGAGGRLWTKTGKLGINTSKALDDRGVASCLNNPAEFASAIAFRGDSVVDIKHYNPCIMAMMLAVHLPKVPDPASQIPPPNDVHGTHANIISWQDSVTPAPLGCSPAICDGDWRFGPLGGGTEDVVVRRVAFFYMTDMPDRNKGTYQGLLLRVFDSSSPLVAPGNPGDGDLVVKLTCLNGAC